MISLFIIKCLTFWITLLHCSHAFVVTPSRHTNDAFVTVSSSSSPKSTSRTTIIPRNDLLKLDMVFGNKKTKSQKELEEVNSKYWQGDWVCKDCGYIYNRVRNMSYLSVYAHKVMLFVLFSSSFFPFIVFLFLFLFL